MSSINEGSDAAAVMSSSTGSHVRGRVVRANESQWDLCVVFEMAIAAYQRSFTQALRDPWLQKVDGDETIIPFDA
jgi:hypothetical protein